MTNETGPVIYFATEDFGVEDREYRFNFKRVGPGWRAYILRMPSLKGRNAGSIPTHRLWDGDNKPYICWNAVVSELKDIETVARVWADHIQKYIAKGTRFGGEQNR